MAPSPDLKQERLDSFFKPRGPPQEKARLNPPQTSPDVKSPSPRQSEAKTTETSRPLLNRSSASKQSSSQDEDKFYSSGTLSPAAGWNHVTELGTKPFSSSRPLPHSPKRVDPSLLLHSTIEESSSPLSPAPDSSISTIAALKRPLECKDDSGHNGKRRSRSPSVFTLQAIRSETSTRHQATTSKLDHPRTGLSSSPLSSPLSISSHTSEAGKETQRIVSSSQDDENTAPPIFLSEDEECSYSTESSLEDIDSRRNIPKISAFETENVVHSHSQSPEPGSASARSTRSTGKLSKGNVSMRDAVRAVSRGNSYSTPSYKYSLQKLVQSNQNDRILQAQIAEVKVALAGSSVNWVDSNILPKSLGPDEDNQQEIEKKSLLHSVVKDQDGEDDRVEKFMQAMDRISAPKEESLWYFLSRHDDIRQFKLSPFPSLSPTDKKAGLALLENATSRDQIFLTGGACYLLPRERLSFPIVKWMWEASILEPREDLTRAYFEFLQLLDETFEQLIDVDYLKGFLTSMGVLPEALDLTEEVRSAKQQTNFSYSQEQCYLPVISRLLRACTELTLLLSVAARSYLIGLFFRLAADSFVAQDGGVQLDLQDCLVKLIVNIPGQSQNRELFRACETIFSTVKAPALQLRIITHLPLHNPTLRMWKASLALSFCLNDAASLQRALRGESDSNLAQMISDHIALDPQYPKSKFESFTDFDAVCAFLSLLDIGVASGFSVNSSLPKSTASIKKQSKLTGFQAMGSLAADPRSAALAAHDTQIDIITKAIQTLNNSIADTGLSNTSRMDTKGVIERLLNRLEYSVRSRPRTKRDMLGQSSKRLESYFTNTKKEAHTLEPKIDHISSSTAKRSVPRGTDQSDDTSKSNRNETVSKADNENEQFLDVHRKDSDDVESESGNETFYDLEDDDDDDDSDVIKLTY